MSTSALFLSADLGLQPEAATGTPKRFGGVAYSGGPVSRYGGTVVVDLATLRVESPLPCFLLHDDANVIGSVSQVTNDGRQITDTGELFSDIDPTAKGIVDRAMRGVKYQQSLGVYGYSEDSIPAGKKVTVNGQAIAGPATVMRNGHLREISICPLGADPSTSASFFRASTEDKIPMATDTELQEKVAQLTAEINGFKQKVPDLTRQAEEATVKIAQLTAERDALAVRLTAVRLEQVKALFKALGKEFTDAAAAPYLALSDGAYAAISADMNATSAKPGADDDLFRGVATGPTGEGKKSSAELLSLENIYGKRRGGAK